MHRHLVELTGKREPSNLLRPPPTELIIVAFSSLCRNMKLISNKKTARRPRQTGGRPKWTSGQPVDDLGKYIRRYNSLGINSLRIADHSANGNQSYSSLPFLDEGSPQRPIHHEQVAPEKSPATLDFFRELQGKSGCANRSPYSSVFGETLLFTCDQIRPFCSSGKSAERASAHSVQ